MRIFVVFCLAGVLASAVCSPSWAGQTKTITREDGWYRSAVEAAPAVIQKYGRSIRTASRKHGVPPELVASIILVESTGNHRARGGLMQTSHAAARAAGVTCDRQKPECQIDQGAGYLGYLKRRFGYDEWIRVAVAYNCGPLAADRVNLARSKYAERVALISPEIDKYL